MSKLPNILLLPSLGSNGVVSILTFAISPSTYDLLALSPIAMSCLAFSVSTYFLFVASPSSMGPLMFFYLPVIHIDIIEIECPTAIMGNIKNILYISQNFIMARFAAFERIKLHQTLKPVSTSP